MTRPLKILFAAHSFMGGPFVVGSHHLARELIKPGHRVMHLSTPLTLAHFLRAGDFPIARARLRRAIGGAVTVRGVADVVPLGLVPWRVVGGLYRRSGRNFSLWTLPPLETLLRRGGMLEPDLMILDQPNMIGLERLARPRRLIYRATDLYAEITGVETTHEAERDACARAEGLVGTSEPVVARLRALAPDKPTLLLENGVEYEHFARSREAPDDYASIRKPRLVFVGALDGRFDTNVVRWLAQARSHVQIVLIGPDRLGITRRLTDLDNVHCLGPRPYEQVPGYLQYADIGLLALNDHPANGARSPMKLYEYAAAGLQVLSRETPEIARRAEPFIHSYRSPEEAVALLDRALGAPVPRAVLDARARAQSWAEKAQKLLDFALSLR